jgi:hypothetical protein
MFVKIAIGLMVALALIYFSPVLIHMQNGNQIHGSTNEQVLKSAMQVRRNLPTQERHSFDVAFGLLKQFMSEGQGENAFASAVGGKSTDEVVEMARKEVAVKIAAGDPKFKQFTSWDDMLSKEAAEDAPKRASAQPAPPLRNSERTGRGE